MEWFAERLAEIPGVVAVALGGSRAQGTEAEDSDWDFALYYRGSIDPDDVRALDYPGEVFAPGEWAFPMNGGAWLRVDGERVDLIYRDLDDVERWIRRHGSADGSSIGCPATSAVWRPMCSRVRSRSDAS